MAVYDPEDREKDLSGLSPEELAGLEQKYSTKDDEHEDKAIESGELSEDEAPRGGMGRKLREFSEAEDEDEDDALEARLGGLYKAAKEADGPEGSDAKGFYSNKKILGISTGDGFFARYKKWIAIAGAGGLTVLIGSIFSFGNFLAVFKLDHILQNIDAKTFSHFNASFSGRSNSYLRAYMKLRLAEISDKDGNYTGDNLFFKAGKVDTNSPIKDWYRTLRTGKFEKDLREKQGITFTSVAIKNPDGSIKLGAAKIKMKDGEIPFDKINQHGIDNIIKAGNGDLTAINSLGSDLDTFFDVQIFNNNKEARKIIKEDVKANTHFYNVLKRRHIRKDIQNTTGIGSWKFFETTRDKISAKKVAFQQKMLKKVLPNNKAGQFLNCILGSGPCSTSLDPASPDNQAEIRPSGDPASENDTTTAQLDDSGNPVQPTDENGKPITTNPDGSPAIVPDTANTATAVADDAAQAVEGAASKEISDDALNAIEAEGTDLIAKEAEDDAVPLPTKVWSYLERFTKIFHNLDGGSNNKIAKLITNFRTEQVKGIYAAYQIMDSQAHSGQLTAQEFGTAMESISDASQSEGWINLNNPGTGTASAEATDPGNTMSKDEYCKSDSKKQIANKIHFDCYLPGVNKAASLANAFKNSFIYQILKPIASAVDAIHNNPVTNFFSGITNFINGLGGDIANALHLNDALSAVLSALHITQAIGSLIGYVTTHLMSYMGASPIFFGAKNQPGGVNHILAGAAATAQDSTRSSGGVMSTPKTLAYTNELASNYEKEQKGSQSLYSRYASLNSYNSLFSNVVFATASMSVGKATTSVGNAFASIPNTFMSLFSGRIFADPQQDFDAAKWAGIQTYDIPQECMNLDPLDTNYFVDAVGVVGDAKEAAAGQDVLNKIRPQLNSTNEQDSAAFWKLVYDTIGNPDNKDDIAGSIYNCALFDQRVRGGLGAVSGYTADAGLNEGSSTSGSSGQSPSTTSPQATTAADCAPVTGNKKIICAAKEFLGVRYANRNAGTGDKWLQTWNVTSIDGSLGQNPPQWIAQRIVGSNNDFLECSGYVRTAIYAAYGVVVNANCSAAYLSDKQYFQQIDLSQLQPGDMLVESLDCGNGGHIGIYLGTTATGRYSSLESSAGKNTDGKVVTGFYEKAPSSWKYAARYIGPGSGP